MEYKSLFINLEKKSCFVIGGGKTAARAAELLLKEGALITVWSENFAPEFQQLLKEYPSRLNLLEAEFTPEVAGHYCSAKVKPFVVITALPDEERNQLICQICRDNHVLSSNPGQLESEVIFVNNYSKEPLEFALLVKGMPILGQLLQNKVAKLLENKWLPAIYAYQDFMQSEFVSGLGEVEQSIVLRRLAQELIKAEADFETAKEETLKYYQDLQEKDELLLELANERARMD